MKIKEIKVGETGVVEGIIVSLEQKETKTNGTYVQFLFSDGESQVTVRKWNATLQDLPFTKGSAVFMNLRADAYDGKTSYVAKEITESSSAPENFICGAPVSSEAMYSFLYKNAEKCGVYAPVVTQILKDNKDKLLTWAAAKSYHHNLRGGLLYHTYRMTKCAAYIASVYNKAPSMFPGCRDIDTELLVAGTILHDIGKLQELDTDVVGLSDYTPKGNLMGHLFLGAELVGRYARKLKLSEEATMLLQHMILAHHGKYEYQTVALPAIPEAMVLHHLDMIDSQMYQYEVQAAGIEPGTMSEYSPGLGGRAYRPTWRVAETPDGNA